MAKWVPLHDVLYPAPPPPPPQTPPPHPTSAEAPLSIRLPQGEPATAKQKALLSYLGIGFSTEVTKDQAAILVNDAMEEPKHSGRLAQWNKERFTLHPDLFASEIHERKESRATCTCGPLRGPRRTGRTDDRPRHDAPRHQAGGSADPLRQDQAHPRQRGEARRAGGDEPEGEIRSQHHQHPLRLHEHRRTAARAGRTRSAHDPRAATRAGDPGSRAPWRLALRRPAPHEQPRRAEARERLLGISFLV